MKKFFKNLVIIFFLVVIGYFIYIFFMTPDDNYQSVYLVPEDAAYIIETDNPFKAWNKIIESKSWKHLSSNKSMAEINETILSADSLIHSKRFLLQLLGNRRVLISAHESSPLKYNYFIVVNLKKISKLKGIKNHLDKILGDEYGLTQRDFKSYKIFELHDKESGEMLYFSFIKDQMILSSVYVLLEKSISQMNKLTIGRDLNYIDIAKRISGKGLFNIYINHDYFNRYVTSLLGRQNDFIKTLDKSLYYSGFSFDIDDDGNINLKGYSNINDSEYSLFKAFMESGKGSKDIFKIIPERTASYIGLGFDDIDKFYANIEQYMKTSGSYDSYKTSSEKIEKMFKINIKENFLDWIDNEIALIQTQPSNLGRNNEFAVIFKAKSKPLAEENLNFITSQIRKNSPVKFKSVDYKGYKLNYLHIPGIFKMLFGKLLQRLEKPYFTIINDYVIFSNHPQTLKSIIDDFEEGRTIAKKREVNSFNNQFSNRQNVFLYSQPPVLFDNLRDFVSYSTWISLKKNKEYIVCFPQVGFQLDNDDDLFKVTLNIQYNDSIVPVEPASFQYEQDTFEMNQSATEVNNSGEEMITESEITINELDANKHEEFFNNKNLKLSVGIKNGLKDGTYKEFYEDGSIKVKGKYKDDIKDGNWKYFDNQGNVVKDVNYNNGVAIE